MALTIILCILCSIISYYTGWYIGIKRGAEIAKKAYREILTKHL